MKTFILVLLLSFLSMAQDVDYSGHWSYRGDGASFSLMLEQKGTSVTGKHISTMLDGQRIDAALGDEVTIQGTIRDGELIVSVLSSYDGGKGKAHLSFVGQDSIYFEFVTPPSGEYWIPDKIVLTKLK